MVMAMAMVTGMVRNMVINWVGIRVSVRVWIRVTISRASIVTNSNILTLTLTPALSVLGICDCNATYCDYTTCDNTTGIAQASGFINSSLYLCRCIHCLTTLARVCTGWCVNLVRQLHLQCHTQSDMIALAAPVYRRLKQNCK